VAELEKKHEHTIIDYDFKPGELVLVLNKKIEPALDRKGKPHYSGPMLVVHHSHNNSYRLAEVTGTVSRLKFAVFHLIPYYPRCRKIISITTIIDGQDLLGKEWED
jgi:hypothetical protein